MSTFAWNRDDDGVAMADNDVSEFGQVMQLGSTGQLTIPKALRTAFGLAKGGTVRVSADGGRIVIEPVAVLPLATPEQAQAATDAVMQRYSGAFERLGKI